MKAIRPALNAILLLFVLLLLCAAAPSGCAGRDTVAAETAAGETAPGETTGGEDVVGEAGSGETATGEDAAGETETTATLTAAPVVISPNACVLNGNLRPGEPFTVALVLPDVPNRGTVRALLLNNAGRQIEKAVFFNLEDERASANGVVLMAALLAIPSTMGSGQAVVRIEGLPDIALPDLAVTVAERDFVSETIDLDARNTAIRTEPDPQKTKESDRLWAILNHTGTRVYTEGVFTPPVTSTRRTSFYGDRRVYRYVDGSSGTSVHAGVDYGVPKGTQVSACAPGLVILAQFRIATGNSVIIEHLPGVYSLYYHLDSLAVREGDLVVTGTILGESGATGLATGPHLHWEVRVAGENTDPDAFTARPLLDKGEIFSKLGLF
jgi:murein DD-endopeptidase MepM/ murein hydrolase activator NlpD